MKRVAIYTRESSREQDPKGLSLGSQAEQLREYAKQNDMQIVDIVKEGDVITKKAVLKGRKGGHRL
jgi:DNA invertase Pin-like site-specific DNA recombinase